MKPNIDLVIDSVASHDLAESTATLQEQDAPMDEMTIVEALQCARCLAEVDHPFAVSAVDMTRELATISGIKVSMPATPPMAVSFA